MHYLLSFQKELFRNYFLGFAQKQVLVISLIYYILKFFLEDNFPVAILSDRSAAIK